MALTILSGLEVPHEDPVSFLGLPHGHHPGLAAQCLQVGADVAVGPRDHGLHIHPVQRHVLGIDGYDAPSGRCVRGRDQGHAVEPSGAQ